MPAKVTSDPVERFWSKVNRVAHPAGCWTWLGRKNPLGYGRFCHGREINFYAHRFAFEASVRKLAEGECVLHRCDNASCVNPAHLFPGDRDMNNKDTAAKGRMHRGEQHGMAKLTRGEATTAKYSSLPNATLAKIFGVAPRTIRDIRNGITWRHV